jgi:hypothetical protein
MINTNKILGNILGNKIRKDMHSKNKNNVTIEPVMVSKGSGNNPYAGKRDLHYKIKEWGFIFSDKKTAEKFVDEHKELDNGEIVKK